MATGKKTGGKRKTPTAALRLAGSKWEKYEGGEKRKKEPKPEPAAPRMPVKMSPAAKKYWKWIVPKLEQVGIISHDNRETVKRYCALQAIWDELYLDVLENGVSQITAVGTSNQRAEFRSMMTIGEECRRLEIEFGMTPSSRAGIQVINVIEEKTDDPKKAYFA